MHRPILLVLLTSFLLCAAAQSSAVRPPSLCANDERVLFSCAMKTGGKMLSVCGSRRLDAERGYVQYRFGRAGAVELEFPKTREKTQSAFRYTRYTRPLVTYLVLRFDTGGYLYSVHQNYNDEEKPPVRSASVTISRTNAQDSAPKELQCRWPVEGSLASLEDVVQRADDDKLEP